MNQRRTRRQRELRHRRARGGFAHHYSQGGYQRSLLHELLEERRLLAADFGDAPEPYPVKLSEHGARHTVTGPTLGTNRDAEADGTHSAAANADDVADALPDDEDGVLSLVDLLGTVGAQPTVTLMVTNTSGSEAVLSGRIDYNQDGVFDNDSERAQETVSSGTTDQRVTLTFPTIPENSTGDTYARFRFSTDVMAQDPNGAASDGEVEDYLFAISNPGPGTARSTVTIASDVGGGPTLTDSDQFGSSSRSEMSGARRSLVPLK